MGLPQVESSTSGAGLPSYSVGGRAFVFFREPRKDALDPETGERMEDVIVFHVGDLADKEALVQADGPFFTTPHWNGYRAVLLRERHLGQLSRRELEEVITDAWVGPGTEPPRQGLPGRGVVAQAGGPAMQVRR